MTPKVASRGINWIACLCWGLTLPMRGIGTSSSPGTMSMNGNKRTKVHVPLHPEKERQLSHIGGRFQGLADGEPLWIVSRWDCLHYSFSYSPTEVFPIEVKHLWENWKRGTLESLDETLARSGEVSLSCIELLNCRGLAIKWEKPALKHIQHPWAREGLVRLSKWWVVLTI